MHESDSIVWLCALAWGGWILIVSILIPVQLSAIRRELRGIAKHMGVDRELSRVERYEAEQRAELEREIEGAMNTNTMRSALALCLLMATAALAADEPKPWPQKGNTVFVAATLIGRWKDTPACAESVVRKAKAGRIEIETYSVALINVLDGDWTAMLFRSQDECRQAIAQRGEPKVRSININHHSIVAG